MTAIHREQLIELLEPVVKRQGFELADLELNLGNDSGLLRIFIDSKAGITVENCADVSRQVSSLLDVEDPIPGYYNLEVSSPGLNRRLWRAADFERFAGCEVKVKLKRLIDERRNIKALLIGCEGSTVKLQEGDKEIAVPLQEIDMARLVPDYKKSDS
jgi:ribosome maturation factor RimP